MRVFRSALLAVLTCLMLVSARATPDDPDAVLGKWLSSKKRNQVQIYRQGDRFFGRIVWMLEPNDPTTRKPKLDAANPDAAQRDKPLMSMVVMKNLTYQGNQTWGGGEVYNPEDGKTYGCEVSLKGPNILAVRGYMMGVTFLGQTKTWTRVQ